MTDTKLRRCLVDAGHRRLGDFASTSVRSRFVETIRTLDRQREMVG